MLACWHVGMLPTCHNEDQNTYMLQLKTWYSQKNKYLKKFIKRVDFISDSFCQNKKKKELTEIIKKIFEIAKVDKIRIFSGEVRKHRSLRRDSVSGQH